MANQNFKVKKGLEVGTALTATSDGLNVTGVVTATQFSGDGSGLTGITAAGSGVVVQEEGSSVGTAATINFIGSNVTAAISSGIANVTVSAGGLSNVVEDTTPQLGGNLDLNSKDITGTGNISITGGFNATGVSTFQESVTFQSHASFGDNDKANFGAGNDIQIYHNGTNSFIDNATGSLYIRGANGNHVRIQSPSGEESIVAAANGSVDLYYDNSKKLETTNTGVTVTGAVSATTFSGAGSGLTDVDADNASNLLVSNQTGNAARVITFAGTSAGGVNAAVFGNANFTYNPSTTELKVGSGVTINSTGVTVVGISTLTGGLHIGSSSDPSASMILGGSQGTQGINFTGVNSSDANSTHYKNIRLNRVGGGFRYDLEFHSNGYSSGDIGDFIFYKRGTSFGRTERMRLNGQTGQLTVTGGGSFAGVVTATSYSGSGSALTDLTGASAGTYGASTNTPIITVDSNGRITGISTVATSGAGGGGGISNIVEDTTPQLGGDLDLNGNDITGTGNITITSVDAGSSAGPEFKLFRNSASPADADYIGQIKFAGESDTGVERNYAKITGKISDASNGTEDGIIEIAHIKAGSQNISARWTSTELKFLNGTNVSMADGLKLLLGTGDDVDIYHDGTDGYFRNATGQLLVRGNDIKLQSYLGETYATFANNGAASLYYDNALKLATSATGATLTGTLAADGITLGDSDILYFGAGDDLQVYHDGTDTWIDNDEGDLYIRNTGDDIIIRAADDVLIQTQASEGAIIARGDGQVELYHNNSKKLETTTTGATVTGALTATTIVKSGGTSSQYLMADGSVSTTVGISTNSGNIQATWSVTANGSSAYRFTGPGNDGSDNNPDLYLVRGQRYRFANDSGGSHPFQIRSVVGGSAYSAGVTNNGAASGNIEFNVQHDAPSRLFYQCTSHSGMVGNIYITGGGQWQNTSVAASGTPEIYTDYNVGIGTDNPDELLEVGDGTVSGALKVSGQSSSVTSDGLTVDWESSSNSTRFFSEPSSGGSSAIRFFTKISGTRAERLRIHTSGQILIGRTSTTHEHPLQVQAASGANAIAIQGRSVDDQSEITFYENDNSTITAQIQQLSNRSIFRHRVGYLRFDAGGTSESMRLDSSGRLLINTDDSRIVEDHVGNGPQGKLQIEAQNSDAIMSIISAGTADAHRCGTINLGRHRNSTVGGTPTIVNDNDALGAVVFSGGDGTDMRCSGAKIHAEVDGTPAENSMPSALVFSTNPGGQTSLYQTEKMRITSAGKIGIGVGSPAEMMEITNTGGTGTQIQLRDTSTGTGAGDGVRFGYNGSGAQIWNFENTYIRFATNNAERLRIDSAGIIKTPNLSGNNHREIHRHITGFQGGSSVVNYLIICQTDRTNVRLAGRLFTARASGTSACSSQLFDITFQTNHNATHRSGAIMGLHSGSEGYGHTEAEFVSLTYNSTNYYAIRFNGSSTGWTSDFDTCSFDGIREHLGTELFTQINNSDHTITNISVLTADTNKGDVTIQQADLRISDGDVIMASGHGISFSATANGGTGTPSELLDDYEEGFFTPTIEAGVDNGSGGAPAFAIQAGRYIKIGKKVHCDIYIRFANGDYTTGAHARIGNLPFAISNDSYGNVGASNLTRGGGVSTFHNTTSDITTCYGNNGTAYFYLYKDGGTNFYFGGGNNVNLNGTYWIGIFEYISNV